MIAADLIRTAALMIVPVAFAIHGLSLVLLASVALVVGAASIVFDIGSFAYVPSQVAEDDLPFANRAIQGSTTAAQVGGPGVAGLLVGLLGPALAVTADASSYLASVVGLCAARRQEPLPTPDSASAGVLEGLRRIVDNPILRALTAHAAIYNAAAQILIVNLVVWAIQDRGMSVTAYGLALSAAGAGAFAGTMAALRLSAWLGYGHAFCASLALSTGVPLIYALLPLRGDALAAVLGFGLAISGFGLGSANVLSITLRQVVIGRGSLARSNGAYRLIIYGVIPIGAAMGGVIGQACGSTVGVAIGALGLTTSSLPMLQRRVRTLRDARDARILVCRDEPRDQDQSTTEVALNDR